MRMRHGEPLLRVPLSTLLSQEAVVTYSSDEINAALERVEAAKLKHPEGWGCLGEFDLPAEKMTLYSLNNAVAHQKRMAAEDRVILYSVGWLQGLMVGLALHEQRVKSSTDGLPPA